MPTSRSAQSQARMEGKLTDLVHRKRSSSLERASSSRPMRQIRLSKRGVSDTAASETGCCTDHAVAIALPGQQNLNRALTSATEPTTAQGLTLDEVILRFRHPNAGVRKETLGGLKDIVSVNPQREVGQVVRALGGLVSDDVSRGFGNCCTVC